MLDVHDDVAQAEEVLRVQRLGEEVGEVVVRVDERHAKTMVLDGSRRTRGCRSGACCKARLYTSPVLRMGFGHA